MNPVCSGLDMIAAEGEAEVVSVYCLVASTQILMRPRVPVMLRACRDDEFDRWRMSWTCLHAAPWKNERQSGAFRAGSSAALQLAVDLAQENRIEDSIVDWRIPTGVRCIETLSFVGPRGQIA